jgi:Holliday junction resolvase RusA-like endonuclease
MQFFFTRPKSHFTSKGAPNPRAPVSHTKRPDIDNLVKAVMDAVTDTELFWFDDSQVVELLVSKSWSMESRCLLELQTI